MDRAAVTGEESHLIGHSAGDMERPFRWECPSRREGFLYWGRRWSPRQSSVARTLRGGRRSGRPRGAPRRRFEGRDRAPRARISSPGSRDSRREKPRSKDPSSRRTWICSGAVRSIRYVGQPRRALLGGDEDPRIDRRRMCHRDGRADRGKAFPEQVVEGLLRISGDRHHHMLRVFGRRARRARDCDEHERDESSERRSDSRACAA